MSNSNGNGNGNGLHSPDDLLSGLVGTEPRGDEYDRLLDDVLSEKQPVLCAIRAEISQNSS